MTNWNQRMTISSRRARRARIISWSGSIENFMIAFGHQRRRPNSTWKKFATKSAVSLRGKLLALTDVKLVDSSSSFDKSMLLVWQKSNCNSRAKVTPDVTLLRNWFDAGSLCRFCGNPWINSFSSSRTSWHCWGQNSFISQRLERNWMQ